MLNWGVVPDLAALGLLSAAFASVSRRNRTHHSKIWLIGWLLIALHFAAYLFLNEPGAVGTVSGAVGSAALAWAGVLFMWATVPYRMEASSRWILASLLFANTLYILLLVTGPVRSWVLDLAALLFGVLPVAVTFVNRMKIASAFRWIVIGLYCSLSLFLLVFQHQPNNGRTLALNAVFFAVFIGCCIHFSHAYRRPSAGSFITIAGFLAWAMVFVIAPYVQSTFPTVHVDGEVWNLPKFLVAIGMILLLLEEQIKHNEYLALHDHLTGLPNRRLYQDRLALTLERARRSGSQAALLVIDLDSFKEVNDTLGHHMGDMVLKKVSELFTSRVRRSDTVARTGGDEFSVILGDPISRNDALLVGRSLMELLREPFEIDQNVVQIGASVGIAVYPEDALEMESLCIAADLRMYKSKRTGRRNLPQSGRKEVASVRPLAADSSSASLRVAE